MDRERGTVADSRSFDEATDRDTALLRESVLAVPSSVSTVMRTALAEGVVLPTPLLGRSTGDFDRSGSLAIQPSCFVGIRQTPACRHFSTAFSRA